jgi:phosphate transport system substrate-binding protein
MKLTPKTWLILPILAVLALGVAACGDDDNGGSGSSGSGLSGEIAGAGSSAQEAAQEAWRSNFQDQNPDVTISYDPVGSGGGREQFIAGGVAYAGSDSPLETSELTDAKDRCGGDVIQVPDYISPIAVVYNLSGVDSLQLSPETVAGIFHQDITNWNDPAIAKDNPDAQLPDQRITPVNRSDDSGTTANFTDYLSQTAPDVWTDEPDGIWPIKGGEAAEGTSGVIEAVTAGDGAIGYADESQAGDLGIAKIKVGDEYVAPTAEGASKVVETSSEDKELGAGDSVFAYAINRTSDDPSTYPVVLVSYAIACTKYDSADEGAIVKDFLSYVDSTEGQQAAAGAAGSAPLSDKVLQQVKPAVDSIDAGP